MLNRSVALVLVSVLLLASGCAAIPQAELTAYTTAVNAARDAGQTVTQDWQAARSEFERRESVGKPPPPVSLSGIPLAWTPPTPNGTPANAEQVRLMAWQAIADYTAILAALNAGESVDAVKASTGRLVTLVDKVASGAGSAIPGIGALGTLFKELASELEKARLSAEFKKAIKSGAPKVRDMLKVFREDTIDHYRLRAVLAEEDYTRIKGKAQTTADPDELKLKLSRIKDEMDEFRKGLAEYVRLLDQTDRSIVALTQAVDKPIDFAEQTSRLLGISIVLKQHWGAYQNARRDNRS